MLPYSSVVPLGATALRPSWDDLPDAVRAEVRRREGTVASATSSPSGFTPGFASVLSLADGRRVFCKAADDATRGMFADAYRAEVALVRRLPASVPAPALRWTAQAGGWVVVCFEAVTDAHPPRRPWDPGDLAAVLELLDSLARVPASAVGDLPAFADEYAELPAMWGGIVDPRTASHRDELRDLAERALSLPHDDVLCHTDVRDDNLLRDPDGRWWLCDWNWACRGPAVLDALMPLVSAHGDGLDADAFLGTYAPAAAMPSDDVDAYLALLLGYFWSTGSLDDLPTSPSLRAHQRWYGDATWSWLASRRGWDDLGPGGRPW